MFAAIESPLEACPVVLVRARLERLGLRAPLLVDAKQLLDPLLGPIEPLLRQPRELDPLLEELERVLESEIALLEPLHDLREALDGSLE